MRYRRKRLNRKIKRERRIWKFQIPELQSGQMVECGACHRLDHEARMIGGRCCKCYIYWKRFREILPEEKIEEGR